MVDDGTLQSRMLDNQLPTLAVFTSPTCPPCRILARRLPELERQLNDAVDIVQCRVESSLRTAREHRIAQVLTFGSLPWRRISPPPSSRASR